MTKDVLTVEPDVAIVEAAKLMAARRIRRIPVLATKDFHAPLVGIVSATDVLHALPHGVNPFVATEETAAALAEAADRCPRTVAEIMTPHPLTTTAEAPIETAAALMRDRKIGALPVIRGEHLVGLITESDVFRAFTNLFNLASDGVRLTFDISQGEDVLPFIAGLADKHDLRVTSFVALHEHPRPMCVAHVAGRAIESMLNDVWRSHHRVESVIRSPEAVEIPEE